MNDTKMGPFLNNYGLPNYVRNSSNSDNYFKAPESAKPDIMVKDREAYSGIDNSSF
ncbi:MAG: hypothetical protein WBL67_10690 [Nitrososphaeraceae archaeon]